MKKRLDDILKDFEKRANKSISSNRPLWEGTSEDNIYDVDIHIWIHPGMGNSLQTIVGNKVSIFTATAIYLQTLVEKEVISIEDLDGMIDLVREVLNGRGNS